MSEATSTKPAKKTRERADQTRQHILDAAIELFSSRGFDGVTVTEIEKRAQVHRGLIAYHYDNKENLWKAAASATLGQMRQQFAQRMMLIDELSREERLAFIVRFYVRFNARHPEVSALMSQEVRADSWRTEYLVENHVRPACESMQELVGDTLQLEQEAFLHWYYLLISASSTIFYFAPEAALLFGVDTRSDEVVERHAEVLVNMLVRRAPQV